MSSLKTLKGLLDDYYGAGGGTAAWISAFTPSEILRAAGVACYYPESFAASLSGSRKNTEFIDSAKANGFSEGVCSYALLFAGGAKSGGSRFRRVPDPGLLVAANNQCGTILYWWENLQRESGSPLYFIDYPAGPDFSSIEKEYITRQYASLVDTAESVFGKRFSHGRLDFVIENAMRANELWARIQLLRKEHYIPPRIFADALLPLVTMRGEAGTVDYYDQFMSELVSEFSGRTVEKRILWLGYPFWFLREKYPELNGNAGIVMDVYTSWWILDYSGDSGIEKLANAYGKTFLNMPLEWKTGYIENLISEYRIDGVMVHLNRSCKRDGIGLLLISEYLKERNMPTLVIESDMANPDWYNPESVRLNVEAFMELL